MAWRGFFKRQMNWQGMCIEFRKSWKVNSSFVYSLAIWKTRFEQLPRYNHKEQTPLSIYIYYQFSLYFPWHLTDQHQPYLTNRKGETVGARHYAKFLGPEFKAKEIKNQSDLICAKVSGGSISSTGILSFWSLIEVYNYIFKKIGREVRRFAKGTVEIVPSKRPICQRDL